MMDRYPARAVPSTMADIQQQPTYDNLGRDARDPGVQPVPLSRSTRPALIQLVQLALSIATSSVFIVTVDFIVTAVNNSLTAARLLLACARERCTATCALSVACVARAKTFVAFAKTFVAFGSAPESPVLSPSCSSSPPSASPSLHRGRHQSPQSRFLTSSHSTAPAILRSLAPPHQHSLQGGRQAIVERSLTDASQVRLSTAPSPAPRLRDATQLQTQNSRPAPAQSADDTDNLASGGWLHWGVPIVAPLR